ncbi:MAG: 50S ribosomal protein L15 [Phycisphaeraceae bacterium]
MMIHQITEKAGKYRQKKRVGRGISSGQGKTAGRGTKGAGSRSGWSGSIRPGREGGQISFFRRIPKRGFSNFNFRTEYAVVNLAALSARFDDGAEINPQMLIKVGLLRDTSLPVKILGAGDLSKKFIVTADAFSKAAEEKITKAGGTATRTK